MPSPDKVLPMLRKAIDHVRATAGRVGHFVDLQNCDDVLAVGDLHGHVANFQAIANPWFLPLKAASESDRGARRASLPLVPVRHSTNR